MSDAGAPMLFEEHAPLVYARELHILHNSSDAKDATQEVFIRAAKAMSRFEGRRQVHT